jgi:hypothetical protein
MSGHSPQPVQQRVVRRSPWRLTTCDAALPADLSEALWRDPIALVSRGERLRWKVRRTVLLHWNSQKYVFKHYVEPSRRHAAKQLFVRSRAHITWSFAQRLADAGVATPRPLAYVENRWGPLRRDSFLLYPYIEGRTLRSYFENEAKRSRKLHDKLWRQIEQLWQQLALLRVSLGDVNTGNFIVCPAGRLWLIDLDKSRFHRVSYFAERLQSLRWQQISYFGDRVSPPAAAPRAA